MRKVYLLCESFCDPYAPYNKVMYVYQFEVDAVMECNKLAVENSHEQIRYSVISKELK